MKITSNLKLTIAALAGALTMAAVGVAGVAFAAAPVRYSLTCAAISNVALSTSSETVLAAAAGTRKKFCITNRDTTIHVYVAFHATATSADVDLSPGQTICESVEYGFIYDGVVDALAASGTPAIGGWSCS